MRLGENMPSFGVARGSSAQVISIIQLCTHYISYNVCHLPQDDVKTKLEDLQRELHDTRVSGQHAIQCFNEFLCDVRSTWELVIRFAIRRSWSGWSARTEICAETCCWRAARTRSRDAEWRWRQLASFFLFISKTLMFKLNQSRVFTV